MKNPRIVLSVVTVDELRTYFSGGRWSGRWSDGSFDGKLDVVSVKIWPEGLTYLVKVEAVDDPSDSEETSTEKPLKAIADFLGQDLPGGEHFERMSASPTLFAGAVRAAADAILSGSLGRRAALSVIRRLSSVAPMAKASPSDPKGAMAELESKAKEKGWKAKLKKDQHGEDTLTIDVSGVYTAEVAVDSALYGYSFEVGGVPDVSEKGTTEDPIREFEKWSRGEHIDEAVESSRQEAKSRRTVEPSPGKATIPSPEDQAKKTVPAPEDQAKKTVRSPDDRRKPPPQRRPPAEEPLS